ncbi:MAG: VWA domain-containing protein [Desulfobacteraceae bacterium]|nr:VWA domain-containing protein [Desulfobacteraceae bacterium]
MFKLKKNIFAVLVGIAVMFMANAVMAATTVVWTSPANNSEYAVGTNVNPTGQASGVDIDGDGLDLALVIDESGSMGGNRMAAAKTAAIALVDALPPNTTSVAVIGFDSTSHTYRLLTALNPNIDLVRDAINGIGTGGGTNIGAGISEATAVLTSGHTSNRQMMQVVLSDGMPGYPGHIAAAEAAAAAGIVVHTVGIPGHAPTVMQDIATAGNGIYTDAGDLDGLIALFDGTGGNLVGLDHVDILLADGTLISDIATDALGNFILPDQLIALGANVFTATAYGTDGTSASAQLTLTGTGDAPVPEPATMLLMGIGLIGVGIIGRRRAKKQ